MNIQPIHGAIRPACILAAAVWCVAAPAMAASDPMIEGARQCTQYFPVEEQKNSIPTHLLAAISTTESGVYHKGLGMSVPWPWTINVEGKGYHYNSKAEAIASTQSFLAKGYRSIDVGCMQVNLKHHPKAFANLNEAFDPAANVAYSARFLRENYATLGDWIKATAAYHSRTPVHGQRYLSEIERSWNRIVGKVTAARANKQAGGQAVQTVAAVAAPQAVPGVSVQAPRVIANAKPMQEARKVRVIEVGNAPKRARNEVLVVRAAPAYVAPTPVVTVADASAAAIPATPASYEQSGNSVRRVRLDNTGGASVPVTASGPKFVFAN